jgi:hypothetical protein
MAAPRRFSDCDLTERLFYIVFLCLIGMGYLMAISFLYATHENVDGKPGLSLTDIAYTYYGNRSGTRLEAAIRGPMAGYLDDRDRATIVAWVQAGAGEDRYHASVEPITSKRCVGCHRPGGPLLDFTNYAGLRQVANVDMGESIVSLVRVSHIHLFGISLILFAVGSVFRMTTLRQWLKSTLALLPFLGMFVDILAWFLTHWDRHFAVTVVIAGAVLGLALAGQILISLYQLVTTRTGVPRPEPE